MWAYPGKSLKRFTFCCCFGLSIGFDFEIYVRGHLSLFIYQRRDVSHPLLSGSNGVVEGMWSFDKDTDTSVRV